MKARIRGVKYDDNVRFVFWLYPRKAASEADRQPRSRIAIFFHLSCSRQQTYQEVVKTLLKDRTDSSFSLFWAGVLQGKTTEIQTIKDPKLPRKVKAPVRY